MPFPDVHESWNTGAAAFSLRKSERNCVVIEINVWQQIDLVQHQRADFVE